MVMMQTSVQNKKRILIFSTAYLPHIGGAEIAIKEITDRLGDEFEFDLITSKLGSLNGFERIGNVNIYRMGVGIPIVDKLVLAICGVFCIWKLQKKHVYDCFWIVMVSFAGWSAIIHNFLSNKKMPIVLTLQEGDSKEHLKKSRFGLINWSWKVFMRNTSKLTAISNYLIDLAKRYGYKGEAFLVPNGVDIKKFSIFNFQFSKKDLGFKENDVVLITTSRLVKKNGIDDVIEALRLLPENVKFIIIGSGRLEKSLKFKVQSLKLGNRVKFLGEINHDDIPKYLHASDIFIRPSLSEGMGNSFIEAMAAGLPVIATPVGGIPDFLADGETGLFCEVNNPKSIAQKVGEYTDRPDLMEKVKFNARKIVQEKYDWDLIVEQMRSKVFKI